MAQYRMVSKGPLLNSIIRTWMWGFLLALGFSHSVAAGASSVEQLEASTCLDFNALANNL